MTPVKREAEPAHIYDVENAVFTHDSRHIRPFEGLNADGNRGGFP